MLVALNTVNCGHRIGMADSLSHSTGGMRGHRNGSFGVAMVGQQHQLQACWHAGFCRLMVLGTEKQSTCTPRERSSTQATVTTCEDTLTIKNDDCVRYSMRFRRRAMILIRHRHVRGPSHPDGTNAAARRALFTASTKRSQPKLQVLPVMPCSGLHCNVVVCKPLHQSESEPAYAGDACAS